jgi:hypothetical protein
VVHTHLGDLCCDAPVDLAGYAAPARPTRSWDEPWPEAMNCGSSCVEEVETDGWWSSLSAVRPGDHRLQHPSPTVAPCRFGASHGQHHVPQ